MLMGSVLSRSSPFNRLASFAATVSTASPRRRSPSTTGSTMELGDDCRTISSFGTSTNHHHDLRILGVEEELAMGTWAASACGPQVVSTGVSELLTLLIAIQSAALTSVGGDTTNFDPKYYVDLSLKQALNETQIAFDALPRSGSNVIAPDAITNFVKKYFNEPGSDLLAYVPKDFNASPPDFLPNVEDPQARKWALQVHELWLELSRQVAPSVEKEPDLHTLLPLIQPVVVPGARFREVYYWDSYWVIKGLLVSGMMDTAKGVVENLLHLVERFGFVPNGARTYYENRSQPPLLSMMVRAIYDVDNDEALLKRALPILVQEHQFWTSEPHEVRLRDKQGDIHCLSRYWAHWNTARPESSTIDMNVTLGMNKTKQAQVYHDIATAAESGWDFSSRWMEDQQTLQTLRTSMIIPVDLNAFIFQLEKNIRYFAKVLGNTTTEKWYMNAASQRQRAIQRILWNRKEGQWFDAWLSTNHCTMVNKVAIYEWKQKKVTFASNFIPLWAEILPKGNPRVERVISALNKSGLVMPAGIVTSLRNTGQQWDYPNAWAPLVDMIVEGLDATDSQQGKALARDIAKKWLRTNFAAFTKIGKMIEKYDAEGCGLIGGGGEYSPQTGFGWTNGVVLSLLQKYGWPAGEPLSCQ